jgi:16S rRNA processing protein RimM
VPAQRILMGVVGRPHGVRGLVLVHSYTANPADLAGYGPLSDDKGRRWTLAWKAEGIAELRDDTGKPLADRTAAQALTNLRLSIDRDRLPPADDDEFYLADLVGLAARSPDGALLGTVTMIHDYGAGASLEIARSGAAPLVVPFTKAAVPEIDIAGGTVTIDPPTEIVGEAEAA